MTHPFDRHDGPAAQGVAREPGAINTPAPQLPTGAGADPVREGQGAGPGVAEPPQAASTLTLPQAATTRAPATAARLRRARKLHIGHFAFLRSVVQGLDPRESWERYFWVEGEASHAVRVGAHVIAGRRRRGLDPLDGVGCSGVRPAPRR